MIVNVGRSLMRVSSKFLKYECQNQAMVAFGSDYRVSVASPTCVDKNRLSMSII
jgi:hypothetical protein